MKRFILLLSFIIGFTVVKGQNLGLGFGPNLSNSNYFTEPVINFFSGVYYQQHIYKRVYLATGLWYNQMMVKSEADYLYNNTAEGNNIPPYIMERYDYLEVPLNAVLDVLMHAESKWKLFLTCGYAYGYLLSKPLINLRKGTSGPDPIEHVPTHTNFLLAGLEVGHDFSRRIHFATGFQYHDVLKSQNGMFDFWLNSGDVFVRFSYKLKAPPVKPVEG